MQVSRRSVLIALPLAGCAGEARAQLNRAYVAPDGGGDGASWTNAAAIGHLGELIARVAPGGEVLVAADRGEYLLTDAVEITRGGAEGHTIRVRGANSTTDEPMSARVRGNRSANEEGPDIFRMLRGANHLHFSHFDFRDIGNGAFHVSAPVSDVGVEDCTFENLYRFFENTAGDGEGHASIRGFALRRCRGSRAERGFLRLRYNSRDGVIEDCAAEGTANEGGRIPVGCALDDRARNIVYRRVVMENFQQWRSGEYWNGDGFSDEAGNANIRYQGCEARGSTDGGFDCKSRGVVLENCIAEDNKRNYRIWSDRATMANCISRAPNFRGRDTERATSSHLWIGGEGNTDIDIANLTIEDRDATAIIEFNHDVGRVEIRGVTINSPRVNWGLETERVRASMLVGEPVFRPNMANEGR